MRRSALDWRRAAAAATCGLLTIGWASPPLIDTIAITMIATTTAIATAPTVVATPPYLPGSITLPSPRDPPGKRNGVRQMGFPSGRFRFEM